MIDINNLQTEYTTNKRRELKPNITKRISKQKYWKNDASAVEGLRCDAPPYFATCSTQNTAFSIPCAVKSREIAECLFMFL